MPLLDGALLPEVYPVEVNWVTPHIAVGTAIGTKSNMSSLCEAGVTHIINLQDEFDDRAIAGDTAVDIYWLRSNGGLTCETLRGARRFADTALDRPGSRLFIHCMAGRNRSPKLAYAVLVWRGFAPGEAVALLRGAIPDAMVEEEDLQETVALMRDLGG